MIFLVLILANNIRAALSTGMKKNTKLRSVVQMTMLLGLYGTMKNFGLHDQIWKESLMQKIYKSSFFSTSLRTKKKPYYRYL